ncbi:hypothetical protein PISMIDRAFT_116386 [Pisolithus microcarpus 441]|uniref:Uncharacterized protein n=1 Tax=Pisolithus microcarpus 441 TaxID=765257 RepID=A0A0C9XR78_9AGAM|nr:hypothetical protein PISMIDRAFT_116386 [Pisolithus microcarpus 441]
MAVAIQARGPDVHTPSAWQKPGNVARPLHNSSQIVSPAFPPVSGYAQHHGLYYGQQDRWMNQAYRSPPSETITLEISALHEGGPRKGRMRGTPFGSICEGMKDIDARATAPELAALALAKISSKVTAFCPQFEWTPSEFVVRDSSWVDLSSAPNPMQLYFYNDCLHPGMCKNARSMVFKSKQFTLFVVVPEAQWRRYENYVDKLAEEAMAAAEAEQSVSLCRPNSLSVPASTLVTASSFNTSAAARPLSYDIATHEVGLSLS